MKLPNGGQEVKIQEIARVDSGQGAPQGEEWYVGNEVFVKAGDLNSLTEGKYVGEHCKRVNDNAVTQYKLRKYPKNSIVFPKSGMSVKTDNIALLKYDSYVVNHLAIIQVNGNDEDLVKYLYYSLKEAKISKLSLNDSYPSIRLSDIKRYRVVIPPHPQLRKMVAILERADQLKQWRKESDKLSEDYPNSVFLEMFGDPKNNPKHWDVIKINDAIEYSQYGTSVKSNSDGRGYPVVGMGNITYDGRLDLSNHSYVELPREEFEKLKLHKDDVIFNRTNSTELVGKTACWDMDLDAVLASYLVKLKLRENINPVFFTHLLNTRFFKQLFSIRCRKAVNQSNISPTLLKKFSMYLPPVELQNKFASTANQVEQMRAHQRKSQKQIDNLFNALVQKVFRG